MNIKTKKVLMEKELYLKE